MADEVADVIVVGAGNAAFCAALSAREQGAKVLMPARRPQEHDAEKSRSRTCMRGENRLSEVIMLHGA